MGLDAWARFRKPGETEEDEIHFVEEWRKHHRLHNWMEALHQARLKPAPKSKLFEFTAIEDAAAEILATIRDPLNLGGLKELSLAALKSLSGHASYYDGPLDLSGLDSLSLECAGILVENHEGELVLGLKEVSLEMAEVLVKHSGFLELKEEVSLSNDAAKILLSRAPNVRINNPIDPDHRDRFRNSATITKEIAFKYLSRMRRLREAFRIERMHLETSISYPPPPPHDSGAAEGADPPLKTLPLSSLHPSSPESNEVQDREDEIVEIEYFAHIEEVAASILAQTDECLDLYGITELSDEAARHFSQHQGALDLSGLQKLSEIAARHLANHQGEIYLPEELEHGVNAGTACFVKKESLHSAEKHENKLLTVDIAKVFVSRAEPFYRVEVTADEIKDLSLAISGEILSPKAHEFFFEEDFNDKEYLEAYKNYYKEMDLFFIKQSSDLLEKGYQVFYKSSW